jgi:hypothetical protein
MPFLLLLFIFGCATRAPLTYRYSSYDRDPASLGDEKNAVAKIEGELREPLVFASGMDSTFLFVRPYDLQGNLLTNIDPSDLTLSTSEDIEAKPFVLKQGLFKAEIKPYVKSKNIRIRVDWQEKVFSPEILLKTTLGPQKDALLPVIHEYHQARSEGEINVSRGSDTPETATDGFYFTNSGDNRIVDNGRHPNSERTFHFDYLEQARQNLAFEVDDSPFDSVSNTMHSLFMFFPRKQLFVVEQLTGTINVTLPNGEKIIFQKESKEIVDGVFREGPVDVSKDKSKRTYADLRYVGQGVVLRVNARGQPPQLGQYETSKIDLDYGLRGSADVLIMHGSTGQRCRRPKSDFWEPLDVTPIEFKFPTDEEFDSYLRKNCGFGLPKI